LNFHEKEKSFVVAGIYIILTIFYQMLYFDDFNKVTFSSGLLDRSYSPSELRDEREFAFKNSTRAGVLFFLFWFEFLKLFKS